MSSAPESRRARNLRLPLAWRVAVGSAALTGAVVLLFATVMESRFADSVREEFRLRVQTEARAFAADLVRVTYLGNGEFGVLRGRPLPRDPVRVGMRAASRPQRPDERPGEAYRDYGITAGSTVERDGYIFHAVSRLPTESLDEREGTPTPRLVVQYGRSTQRTDDLIERLRLVLGVGVLGSVLIALLLGLIVARRAIAPITRMTAAAQRIAAERDPSLEVPAAVGHDEVAELSRSLRAMLGALGEARAESQELLERQRSFLADASHELRTPLTSVLSNLELVEDGLEGERREAARAALRSARRMRTMVNSLLLLGRADSGQRVRWTAVSLDAVVQDAAGEVDSLRDGHAVDLLLEPAIVDGSRDDLHRLVRNLLENAVAHTPPGTPVRASISRVATGIELVIEDDGPGVPADLGDRVFSRFVRGGGDDTGSTGLGLAIAKAVAERHGGTITLAASTTGRGARFVVCLPESPARPAPVESAGQVD